MDPRAPGIWRPRNAARFDFLERHCCTSEQLARGFFPGRTMETRKKKARRWLGKKRRRGKVRVVGFVQRRDTGRPEIVYGRRVKEDQIEHEVMIAELELIMQSKIFREAKIGNTEADGMMIRDGRKCWIEVDNSGKMTAKQMQEKWKRYGKIDGYILVIAQREARMQRLRKGAEAVKNIALFTTFERLTKGEEPWADWFGNTMKV